MTTKTSGNIFQSGTTVLTVGGTSTFTETVTNAGITLTNNNRLSGAISLNTTGSGVASVTNTQATVLGASTVGGNLTVIDKTSGNVTQSGTTVLTVGGASTFTNSVTDGTITLTNNNLLIRVRVALNTTGTNGTASLTNARATSCSAPRPSAATSR